MTWMTSNLCILRLSGIFISFSYLIDSYTSPECNYFKIGLNDSWNCICRLNKNLNNVCYNYSSRCWLEGGRRTIELWRGNCISSPLSPWHPGSTICMFWFYRKRLPDIQRLTFIWSIKIQIYIKRWYMRSCLRNAVWVSID